MGWRAQKRRLASLTRRLSGRAHKRRIASHTTRFSHQQLRVAWQNHILCRIGAQTAAIAHANNTKHRLLLVQ